MKSYRQNRMIRELFSICISEMPELGYESDDNTEFSHWCSGKRPVPAHIIEYYEDEKGFDRLKFDLKEKVLPHILNMSKARSKAEELVKESSDILGQDKTDEFLNTIDDAEFFASLIRYALLDGQKTTSVILSEKLLTNRVPSVCRYFCGRKNELTECHKLLRKDNPLFICGVAGIGKSEFAKQYAFHNRNKYTSIIYIFYTGDLRQSITDMVFEDDVHGMTPEDLFTKHYSELKKCGEDCLVILDNFNVLPKDDPFFKDFSENDFRLLVTTRCHLVHRNILTLSELDTDTELLPLYYDLCPASKKDSEDDVREIITLLHSHTLCTILAALSMNAAGTSAEEMLNDLSQCGINLRDNEEVELNKDEEYTEALMQEHLRRLLRLSERTYEERYLLQNLSLFPASGINKQFFKNILSLDSLTICNRLGKYGFLFDDEENRRYYLHPMIREIILMDTNPSIDSCRTLFDQLHMVCLIHGLEPERPGEWIQLLLSVAESIVNDDPQSYLLYLQDLFAYIEKYNEPDRLKKLCDRIDYVMKEYGLNDVADKALILDYKAEIQSRNNDNETALKNRLKAIEMMEQLKEEDMDERCISLLSNLYNNLSITYGANHNYKKGKIALQKAIQIRQKLPTDFNHNSHDDFQQKMNLCYQLTLNGEFEEALSILNKYESRVLESAGRNSADYGQCRHLHGIIAFRQGDTETAHKFFEEAKSIVAGVLGNDAVELKSINNNLLGIKLVNSFKM